jgi:hypothetical protein
LGACEFGCIAQTICVILGAQDRERLTTIASDRNRRPKHVEQGVDGLLRDRTSKPDKSPILAGTVARCSMVAA